MSWDPSHPSKALQKGNSVIHSTMDQLDQAFPDVMIALLILSIVPPAIAPFAASRPRNVDVLALSLS